MYVEIDLDLAAEPVEVLSVRIADGDLAGVPAGRHVAGAQALAVCVAAGRPCEPCGGGSCADHCDPPESAKDVS